MVRCSQCGASLPAGSRKSRRYCSDRCRKAAERERHAIADLVPVGVEHGHLPPAAHPDEQVAVAILEARNLSGAFLRLGREARPQLRWRCEGVGVALTDALHRYFFELEG
jgi:hypothetical protein